MAFKPNYRQQRSERTRAKDEKKQAKLAKREADAAKRRAERDGTATGEPGADGDGDAAADRGDRDAMDKAMDDREAERGDGDANDAGTGMERPRD